MSLGRWLIGLLVLLAGKILRCRRRAQLGREPGAPQAAVVQADGQLNRWGELEHGPTILAPSRRSRRAELVAALLLLLGGLSAAGFIVVYAEFGVATMPNELLGACIALSLGFLALALAVFAHRLVPNEELEDDYPEQHPEQQREVAEIIERGGSLVTRRKLLVGAGSAAGGALGLAALTPALSLGPLWYTAPLYRTPWRRGTRVVDERSRPMLASAIEEDTFYTGFPEGADFEEIGSPVVIVRIKPASLRLPAGRAGWAPFGILAYSKICTHAGCAVALYRKPTFRVLEPEPALVCPCHYSTFNPATGASVIFGPAGRPLPQLPLMVDASGQLRAAGNFSGPVGPSWGGVRSGTAK
jgi:quinol---cytochrome c reductase iron-sulfur subunit